MAKCYECGKKLEFGKRRPTDWAGRQFCCEKHKEEYNNKLKEARMKKKEQKLKEKEMISHGMVKEFKCTCNKCKHKWHYLESEEKQLRNQQTSNAMIGAGMCCNPFGAYFMNKSIEQGREKDKFNKCPKCGTGNITKEVIFYEKKI